MKKLVLMNIAGCHFLSASYLLGVPALADKRKINVTKKNRSVLTDLFFNRLTT